MKLLQMHLEDMIDDIKSKIPVSIDLLLLFLLVYKKLTKINMPMITARNRSSNDYDVSP
jgi:hypothetical protein